VNATIQEVTQVVMADQFYVKEEDFMGKAASLCIMVFCIFASGAFAQQNILTLAKLVQDGYEIKLAVGLSPFGQPFVVLQRDNSAYACELHKQLAVTAPTPDPLSPKEKVAFLSISLCYEL
jgi:hypothetical protein